MRSGHRPLILQSPFKFMISASWKQPLAQVLLVEKRPELVSPFATVTLFQPSGRWNSEGSAKERRVNTPTTSCSLREPTLRCIPYAAATSPLSFSSFFSVPLFCARILALVHTFLLFFGLLTVSSRFDSSPIIWFLVQVAFLDSTAKSDSWTYPSTCS
ncbi:hypothetical protein BJ165DRAFT_1418439 [Panaeolus papilionaceus]|nr:hypothetical protein BJ165DRAFT_1418439 [Panaeolus papilionaceus]